MKHATQFILKFGAPLILSCGSIVHAQQYLVPPSFQENTAPNWTILGNAHLTARPAGGDSIGTDPEGEGWMQLTSNGTEQAGSTFLNTSFPSTHGGTIEFEYASYGGSWGGADGFTIYLADGSVDNPNTGVNGGSLGYAGLNANSPGIFGGYIGIGFDEWGNFSADTTGPCDGVRFQCGRIPNSIVVRGRDTSNPPYTGSSGYDMLYQVASIPQGITTGSRAGARKVRITLEPAPIHNFELEVDFNDGEGYTKIIPPFDMVAANRAELPATFRLGFSAATGGVTDFHEIRLLGVFGARSTTTTLNAIATPSCGVARLQATVTVSDPANYSPAGYMVFLNGQDEIGRSLVNARGEASLAASLPEGSYEIVAKYEGDEVYGVSESQAQSIVSSGPCEVPVSVPSLQEWGIALITGLLALFGLLTMREKRRKYS